jgi:DNA-entry nuclease
MEAHSVEDNGEGLSFCVFTYNVQPGIVIDYATGDSQLEETPTEATTEITRDLPINDPVEDETESEEKEVTYILNSNTGKFHYPSCSSVKDMKEKNKVYFYGTRQQAIAKGYVPCKRCNP